MVRSPKKTKALIEAKEKLEKEKLEKEKVEKEKVKSAWEGFGDPDRKPQPINAGRLVDEVRNLQLHLRSVGLEKRKKKCDNKKTYPSWSFLAVAILVGKLDGLLPTIFGEVRLLIIFFLVRLHRFVF